MRAALAALALGLLLVAAGCGNSTAATSALGQDAAALVPSGALAFVAADANLDNDGWRALAKAIGPAYMDAELRRDLRAAVGDQVNLAVLGFDNGKPEAVAIVKPKDEAKLRAFASKFDEGGEKYTVQHVEGWSVVADSDEAFQAVRSAASGSSLARNADFQAAMSELDGGDALADVFVRGAAVQQLPAKLRTLVGSPRWVAARLAGAATSLRIQVHAAGAAHFAQYKPALLRDVPSGAILAVSFKDPNVLLARFPALPFLADLRGITGEGVLYVIPGAILPVITLEVRPRDPAAAVNSLRKLAARIANTLPLNVERRGAKVLLTTAAPGLAEGGRSLVDDQPFKDALEAADAPEEVQWLAYADVQRLAPLVEAFSSLFGVTGKDVPSLERLDTLVAFAAADSASDRIEARLTLR
jgi:hypothetical protein